jgi:2'-5' RNA ligase
MSEFKYADTSHWEGWQREYRYGAFYIFPPPGIIEPIDQLRRKYDPKSDSYCQAHISLSEPLRAPLTEEQVQELHNTLSSVEPFEIHYGPLRIFPPYSGVVYAITPEDALVKLRSRIHETSLIKGQQLMREHITPHMTIAEFVTIERTHELLEELSGKVPDGTFLCSAIEYAIPNQGFYFERVLKLPLGKNTSNIQPCKQVLLHTPAGSRMSNP